MGLLVDVYRTTRHQLADGTAIMGDCTNGGMSSRYNVICITNIEGPSSPASNAPAALLLHGPGRFPNPVIKFQSDVYRCVHSMFGGNFAFSSDTRFGEAVRELIGEDIAVGAVKIFDRVEK